jgi:hypothetical protein
MTKINYDALGIATSVACAIHCAVLPLILTSLPLFGMNIINNTGFEYTMIFIALCVGLYSLWHGYKKHHHSTRPIILFTLGITMLFLKQVYHESLLLFLIPAVIMIVSAHWFNYQSCKKADHCHADDCNIEITQYCGKIFSAHPHLFPAVPIAIPDSEFLDNQFSDFSATVCSCIYLNRKCIPPYTLLIEASSAACTKESKCFCMPI